MAPVWNGGPVKEYNPAAAAEAVTAAVATFASKRAGDPADKSVAWRGYALRLSEALKNWRPLFDPGFNPLAPTKFIPAAVPPVVNDTVANIQALILTPIEAAGSASNPALGPPVQIQKLQDYLRTLREAPRSGTPCSSPTSRRRRSTSPRRSSRESRRGRPGISRCPPPRWRGQSIHPQPHAPEGGVR